MIRAGLSLVLAAASTDVSAVALVSRLSDGSQMMEGFMPAVSQTGRYVVFMGRVGEASPNLPCLVQWFIHDRQSGVTELVSRTPSGDPAPCTLEGSPRRAAVSADGRYVAFDFWSTAIVPGVSSPVILRTYRLDRAANRIDLVDDQPGSFPVMDHSGRYVVAARTGAPFELFRMDMATGAESIIFNGDFQAYDFAISGDGNRVAYVAVEAGAPAGSPGQLFVRDVATGSLRVLRAPDGSRTTGILRSPALDFDGSVVTLRSESPNLNGGTPFTQIVRHDWDTGETEVLSRTPEGDPALAVYIDNGSLSDDGVRASFRVFALNFPRVDELEPYYPQVYVVDHPNGVPRLISVNDEGEPADYGSTLERCEGIGPSICSGVESFNPRMSGDGSTVVFHSFSTNLVPDNAFPEQFGVYAAVIPPGVAGASTIAVPVRAHLWLLLVIVIAAARARLVEAAA